MSAVDQARGGDPSLEARSQARDQWFEDLAAAMRETGWTEDALAAHWHVDRSYINRLLNDEKPWSLDRTLALPDDLEGALEARRAARFGRIVVTPAATREEALQQTVAGLIGLLAAPALPTRADHMAKADVTPLVKAVRR